MAISLDGFIASKPGESDATRRELGFTNDADRQHLREMVRNSDAVIAGAESVRAARRLFADQNDRGRLPTWLIPTNRGLDANLPLWEQHQVRKILVSANSDLPAPPHGEILHVDEEGLVSTIRNYLIDHDLHRVLLLGGAQINRMFYLEKLVNRVVITVCPIILGSKGGIPLVQPDLPLPTHLKLITSHSIGNLVFLTYSVIDQ